MVMTSLMSHKAAVSDIGFSSVDWRTRQARLVIPNGICLRHLARRLSKSTRQLSRYLYAETPVPLHESFRLADLTQDYRLLDSYAHDINKRITAVPQPVHERGGVLLMAGKALDTFQQWLNLLIEIGNSPPTHAQQVRLRELAITVQGQVELGTQLVENRPREARRQR
jgi:hypothetical protein